MDNTFCARASVAESESTKAFCFCSQNGSKSFSAGLKIKAIQDGHKYLLITHIKLWMSSKRIYCQPNSCQVLQNHLPQVEGFVDASIHVALHIHPRCSEPFRRDLVCTYVVLKLAIPHVRVICERVTNKAWSLQLLCM